MKKYLFTLAGIVAGGVAGYLYYRFVGCESGSCSITSSPSNSSIYGAIMGGLVFDMFRKKSSKFNKNGNKSYNTENMTIVDVRTPEEFHGGHVEGSINIPMNEVPNRIEEFKGMAAPLVLCCASGNRSGQVVAFLKSKGIECENGGGWRDVLNGMR